MTSHLDVYLGDYSAIEEGIWGRDKFAPLKVIQLLESYSHFGAMSKLEIREYAEGSPLPASVYGLDVVRMPRAEKVPRLLQHAITKPQALARVHNMVHAMRFRKIISPWPRQQFAGCGLNVFNQLNGKTDYSIGPMFFAGSVMPLSKACELLERLRPTYNEWAQNILVLGATMEKRREAHRHYNGVERQQYHLGTNHPCAVVSLTTSDRNALYVAPLQPGTCVVNGKGLVHYVYLKNLSDNKPLHAFFAIRYGQVHRDLTMGWTGSYSVRAGSKAHAELFEEVGLVPTDKSRDTSPQRRSLFSTYSLATSYKKRMGYIV